MQTAFLFDLDGTLVDSVYQHVLAWREALETEGIDLSVWRVHRKIGMSGGLLTNILLRETQVDIDPARVERLQRLHAEAYKRTLANVRPLPGATALLAALTSAQIPWAIATSGRLETAAPVLEKLGVDLSRTPVITRDQVKFAKPEPDLSSPPRSDSTYASRLRRSWAIACGTCWRRRARERSGSGFSPADMASKNWSAPAHIAFMKTPPICSSTWTRSVAVDSF